MYMREPVFSGYHGGANQYPVISGAMFSLVSPDVPIIEGVSALTKSGANFYKMSKTWQTFAKMTGKGMTFAKKSVLYRNHLRRSSNLLRLTTKTFNNVKNADAVYTIYGFKNYYEKSK